MPSHPALIRILWETCKQRKQISASFTLHQLPNNLQPVNYTPLKCMYRGNDSEKSFYNQKGWHRNTYSIQVNLSL